MTKEIAILDPIGVRVPTLKSLYIEMYFGDTLLSSATAVLVAKNKDDHCCLITNRHNVTGRHQETGECLDRKNASVPDSVLIYFHKPELITKEWVQIKLPLYRKDGEPYWIEHPKLGQYADIVALNLSWGSDTDRFCYFLDRILESTNNDVTLPTNLIVDPAEPVSVIGFPFGLASSGKLPIWATGFLAQELSLITSERPIFYIDCRTRQGQSGSAVIAYRTGGYRAVKEKKISATLSPNTVWEFLGIYSGRVNQESDLGIVWHVSAVAELYEAAKAEYVRRQVNAPQSQDDFE